MKEYGFWKDSASCIYTDMVSLYVNNHELADEYFDLIIKLMTVEETDEIYINEVNTFPGFTQFSMYPSLWEATGLSYSDLIEELIQLGLQRFNERQGYFSEGR